MQSSCILSFDDFPEQKEYNLILQLYSENSENETINFWKRQIYSYSKYNKQIECNLTDLTSFYTCHGIVPISLEINLNQLHKSEFIITTNELLNQKKEPIGYNWISIFSWNTFENSKVNSINSSSKFISIQVLQELQNYIVEYYSKCEDKEMLWIYSIANENTNNNSNELPPFNDFLKNLASHNESHPYFKILSCMSITDAKILAYFMIRNKVVLVSEDYQFIQLINSLNIENNSFIISLNNIAKAKMKFLLKKLDIRKLELEDKISRHHESAIKAKDINDTKLVLFHLKLKKLTMESKDKILSVLLSLEIAFNKVEEAEYNKTIMNAYETSAILLQKTREQLGLSVDAIDEVMISVEEEIAYVDEINNAISRGSTNDEEGYELEKELEMLMNSMEIQDNSKKPLENYSQNNTFSTSSITETSNKSQIGALHEVSDNTFIKSKTPTLAR